MCNVSFVFKHTHKNNTGMDYCTFLPQPQYPRDFFDKSQNPAAADGEELRVAMNTMLNVYWIYCYKLKENSIPFSFEMFTNRQHRDTGQRFWHHVQSLTHHV